MSEILFKALTPDGRVAVEVRVPEEAETADVVLFQCSVTVDGVNVIEELKTIDENKMLLWMRRQMVEAMRRTA